jgi:putative phosphoesterase
MKIAVITDLHANLPALRTALKAIHKEGCDVVFHTGDAIAIGPYPAECIDLLLDTPNIQFVSGNHEAYFVDGLPDPLPNWMSDGEVQHQHWTRKRLGSQLRSALAQWPYTVECEFEGIKTVFVHYGLRSSGQDFVPIIRHPTVADLDEMFERHSARLVFYGHTHSSSDIQGKARYVNPGSLGCCNEAVARYCVAEFERGRLTIKHRRVPYDDSELFRVFEQRKVPARQFLYQAFFGGRFHGQVKDAR